MNNGAWPNEEELKAIRCMESAAKGETIPQTVENQELDEFMIQMEVEVAVLKAKILKRDNQIQHLKDQMNKARRLLG